MGKYKTTCEFPEQILSTRRLSVYPSIHPCTVLLWLSAVDSSVPALVSWWRADQAYLLDVTHPDAVQWLLGNTARLQHAYNVSSFKWDAGDGNWLPHVYSTHRPLDGPDEFSKLFVDMAYRSVCSAHSGHRFPAPSSKLCQI